MCKIALSLQVYIPIACLMPPWGRYRHCCGRALVPTLRCATSRKTPIWTKFLRPPLPCPRLSTIENGRKFTRTAYPKSGGMSQIGRSGTQALRRSGVQVLTAATLTKIVPCAEGLKIDLLLGEESTALEVDAVYWTLPPTLLSQVIGMETAVETRTNFVKDSRHAVSVLVYAFQVPAESISDPTIFRITASILFRCAMPAWGDTGTRLRRCFLRNERSRRCTRQFHLGSPEDWASGFLLRPAKPVR